MDVITASANGISAINAAADQLTLIGFLLILVVSLVWLLFLLAKWKFKQCEKAMQERDQYRDELMRVNRRQGNDT